LEKVETSEEINLGQVVYTSGFGILINQGPELSVGYISKTIVRN
jgi:hypothetical protein